MQPTQSPNPRNPVGRPAVLATLGVLGVLAVVAIVAVGTGLGSGGDPAADEIRYDVEAGILLGDVEAGCINLGQSAADGEVCLAMVEAELELSVSGFEPGSDLTVTGADGDSLTLSVGADGTHRSTLNGAVRNEPLVVGGTVADGRSAGVTIGLLD